MKRTWHALEREEVLRQAHLFARGTMLIKWEPGSESRWAGYAQQDDPMEPAGSRDNDGTWEPEDQEPEEDDESDPEDGGKAKKKVRLFRLGLKSTHPYPHTASLAHVRHPRRARLVSPQSQRRVKLKCVVPPLSVTWTF